MEEKEGWVEEGEDKDKAANAVKRIVAGGGRSAPFVIRERRLDNTADGGGSNGWRVQWKEA